MSGDPLTDFLLARIAEDEADCSTFHEDRGWTDAFLDKMLAECEAKRRVVTLMGYVRESWDNGHAGVGRVMWPDVSRREKMHALTILENLALPYADHPDYRDEWKP